MVFKTEIVGSIPASLVFNLILSKIIETFSHQINFLIYVFSHATFFFKNDLFKSKKLYKNFFEKFFVINLFYGVRIIHYFFFNYSLLQLNNRFNIFTFFSSSSNTKSFYQHINFFNLFKNVAQFLIFFMFFLLFFYIFFFLNEYMPLNKLIFVWGTFFCLLYLLISGFVFFGKRYAFNKYTGALSRFWKRSFSIFWLLEGFLFFIFLYLTLNSSNEVIYTYDWIFLKKTYLFSWRLYSFKLIWLILVILCIFILSLVSYDNDRFFFFTLSFILTAIILFLFYIEFQQFLMYLNHSFYGLWNLSSDTNEFTLEQELRRSRTVKNYVLICIIAKFWHLVFIVFYWFFGINRMLEAKEQKDFLLQSILQNFLILYMLNWISMYAWFKWCIRKYLSLSYFWFYNNKQIFFLNEIYSLINEIAF